MYKITNKKDLEETILLLEKKQAGQKQLLMEQFNLTRESFKPVNIIKSTLIETVTSSDFKNNILFSALGLTTGYFSRKLLLGTSGNPLKRLFGSILQFGIANFISHPPEILKSSVLRLLQLFAKKRNNDSEK